MAGKAKGKVRVALVGCGGISEAHATGMLAHKDKIEAVALADISEANLRERDEQLGGGLATFADWKKMLKQMGDEIDAVDICLPHHLHKPAIIDAARAGKHILCEKPLCLTLREADVIGRALRKARVTYMSAHNQLFMPCVQEAKRMVTSGALGRVFHVRSQDCFVLKRTRKEFGWRGDLATQGGGELIDTGYHPTYRLLHLAGSPVADVKATFARFSAPIDGEDAAAVQIRFKNGIIGEVLTSWSFSMPAGTHNIHVVGEKGQLYGSGNTLYWRPQGYGQPAVRTFPAVNTFTAEIEHFATCLLTGKRPIHGFQEGRDVLEVIVRAAESARGWKKAS